MSVRINILMGEKNWSSYWLLHKHLVTRLLPSYLLSHIGLHKCRFLFYMPRILLSSLQMELLQIKLIPGRRSSPHYRNELKVFAAKSCRGQRVSCKTPRHQREGTCLGLRIDRAISQESCRWRELEETPGPGRLPTWL